MDTFLSHKAAIIGDSYNDNFQTIDTPDLKAREHLNEEWEHQRRLITNLYVAQDKMLWEVMSIMKTTHGFSATERQYKRKLAQWSLNNKNIRDHDMRFVLAKELKRKREGKETDFEINGRLVPRQKMQRFMQRKKLSEDVMQVDVATPTHITYHTPRLIADEDDMLDNAVNFRTLKNSDRTITEVTEGFTSIVSGMSAQNLLLSTRFDTPHTQDALTARAAEGATTGFVSSLDVQLRLQANEFWLAKRKQDREHFLLNFTYRKLQCTQQIDALSPYHGSDGEPSEEEESLVFVQPHVSNFDYHPVAPMDFLLRSPFERWSQRYDISSSPGWIRSYMTPSNPLTRLTPCPIGTPWNNLQLLDIDLIPALKLPISCLARS